MTRLIVLSAPSGGGKTTLCQRLLADFPKLVISISCTTRQPRGSETHGREYFFMAENEFKKKITEDRFAEWACVHGNYYGTSKDVIEQAFRNGSSVLLDIDVQGAKSLRNAFPDAYLGIFIAPPNLQELEKRLRARGTDSEESILRRIENARAEMTQADIFDHVIVNDSLNRAYEELKSLVRPFAGDCRG